MVRAEHQVATFVDQVALFLCRSTPQHEGNGPETGRYLRNQGVGQGFPTLALVAIGLAFFHGQAGIQKQGALLRPRNKTSAGHGHGRPSLA